MNNGEVIKDALNELSRIQDWMLLVGKDTEIYKAMKARYIELKVLLSSLGVNLTEIDRIKE